MSHLSPPCHGFARWSLPEPAGPVLASGCSASLPDCGRLRRGCNGDPQCWLQWLAGNLLHGGVVLLLRHVGRHLLPWRHPPLQLPSRFLGEPHGHVCCLCHPHVSRLFISKFFHLLFKNFQNLDTSSLSVSVCRRLSRHSTLGGYNQTF